MAMRSPMSSTCAGRHRDLAAARDMEQHGRVSAAGCVRFSCPTAAPRRRPVGAGSTRRVSRPDRPIATPTLRASVRATISVSGSRRVAKPRVAASEFFTGTISLPPRGPQRLGKLSQLDRRDPRNSYHAPYA